MELLWSWLAPRFTAFPHFSSAAWQNGRTRQRIFTLYEDVRRKTKMEDLFRWRPDGTGCSKISNFLNHGTSWSFVDAHLASGPSVTLLLDAFLLCSNFWLDIFCPIVTSFSPRCLILCYCASCNSTFGSQESIMWSCITKPFLWLFDDYQLIHFIETAKF